MKTRVRNVQKKLLDGSFQSKKNRKKVVEYSVPKKVIDAFRNVNNSLLLGPACSHMNQICSEFAVNSFDLTFCLKRSKMFLTLLQCLRSLIVSLRSLFVEKAKA